MPVHHSDVPVRESFTAYVSKRLQLYVTLSKGRLSLLVAVSAFWGYLWVTPVIVLHKWVAIFIGGFLIAAASSACNQWMEVVYDQSHALEQQIAPCLGVLYLQSTSYILSCYVA